MQFQAIYSDRLFPVETPATITLQQDRMLVEIPSRNETHEWFYGMILRKKMTDHLLIISHKDSRQGRLTFNDPQFLAETKRIASYAPFVNPTPWYQSSNGLYGMFAVKVGSVVLAIVLFIFAVPLLINFAVNRISPKTESSIGRKVKSSMVSPGEVDTLQTRLVNEFISHLSKPGEDSIHITVVDSRVKNAFTLPGGQILIDSAIFSVMNNYDELVAVIGHESGHAANRHSLKMLCRESSTSVLLLTLVGNMNGVVNVILNNASYLTNLSYSREYEREADHFGFDWMERNNVNPQGMIDLLRSFENEHGSDMNVEFISDHPSLQNRIDEIHKWMKSDETRRYENNSVLDSIWKQIKTSGVKQNSSN